MNFHPKFLEQIQDRFELLLRNRLASKRNDVAVQLTRLQIETVAHVMLHQNPLHPLTTFFRILGLRQIGSGLASEVPCNIVLPLSDTEIRLVVLSLLHERTGQSPIGSPINSLLVKAGGSVLGASSWKSSSSASPRLVAPSDYWSSRKQGSDRTGSQPTESN